VVGQGSVAFLAVAAVLAAAALREIGNGSYYKNDLN
jgi:hypothetical protein